MRLSELQTKKIINVTNGRILGMIIDVIVSNDGKIKSLVLEDRKNRKFTRKYSKRGTCC